MNNFVIILVPIMRQEYFDTEHGGKLVKIKRVKIAISTAKRGVFVYLLSPPSQLVGDIIHESLTHAGIKKHSELYLSSAACSVHRAKALTPGHVRVTQPPGGYF